MKKTILLLPVLMMVAASACWHQQWEDRLESGDTGIVTHGDSHPDTTHTVTMGYCTDEQHLGGWTDNIFKSKCAACHTLSTRELTGPGLKNIYLQIPGRKWADALMRNGDSLYKSGDSYYLMLIRKEHYPGLHRKLQFTDLSEHTIDEMLGFPPEYVDWPTAVEKSKNTVRLTNGKVTGEFLYNENCANCHSDNSRKKFGPSFIGVLGIIPSRDWAYEFVTHEEQMINKGDAFTNKMNKESGYQFEHAFKLSNEEIDAILEYADAAVDY